MTRRSPRGATLVQVVVVVSLIAMCVAGATWALYGQLGPAFGKADDTLAGSPKAEAENKQGDFLSGHAGGEADPNAFQKSMEQSSQQNTQAAAKAKGTP
ncbi:MAG TPA: hypothetical protein VND93_24805 [Myxococcales bacterium]|nr:hypothetical protein [Myxococcales bacterium]